MRLEPIERPRGLVMRLAFWMVRRQFGKVMMPMRVLYPRVPGLMKPSYAIQKFELKGLTLDHELHLLITTLTSSINGCGFCLDLSRAMAMREHVPLEKLDALPDWRASARFSERERAALAYAEEATRHKQVADATFETLRRHFSEREIVEITWVNAVENYYNLINRPLGIESDGFCALVEARARRAAAAAAR